MTPSMTLGWGLCPITPFTVGLSPGLRPVVKGQLGLRHVVCPSDGRSLTHSMKTDAIFMQNLERQMCLGPMRLKLLQVLQQFLRGVPTSLHTSAVQAT
jgi:hypothetical protein